MFEFLEYIKTYLEECFAEDGDYSASKKPKVYDAYQVGHEPKKTQPEIQVQILNNSEQVNYTTFCGIKAESLPLQITAFSGQVYIGGEENGAKVASIKLADKIKKYINNLIYNDNKDNELLTGNHIMTSQPIPMNDGGSIYMTPVRYDFIIQV